MHFIDLASPQVRDFLLTSIPCQHGMLPFFITCFLRYQDPDTPEGRTNLAQLDHFFQVSLVVWMVIAKVWCGVVWCAESQVSGTKAWYHGGIAWRICPQRYGDSYTTLWKVS
jgi:hypothetical protein